MGQKTTNGLWIVLGWMRKPNKLGTGFGWQKLTNPAVYSQTENSLKTLQNTEKLPMRIWPV